MINDSCSNAFHVPDEDTHDNKHLARLEELEEAREGRADSSTEQAGDEGKLYLGPNIRGRSRKSVRLYSFVFRTNEQKR